MQNTKNILLLHNVKNQFGIPQNYLDFIKSFSEFSVNSISYLDPSENCLTIEEINGFDVVVVHHSITLFSRDSLPDFWHILLRTSANKKVLFIQDDFRRVNQVLEIINYIGFSIIFTCLSDKIKDKIYMPNKINQIKVISILTAYVPEYLKNIPFIPFKDRKFDVVYRGRKGSAWYGDLVREKWIIGEKFKSDALLYKLKTNISSDEKDRIYGTQWIDFLSQAKCVLGTESSANVVDYDGSIEQKVLAYENDHPNASYEDIKNLYFKDIDGKLELNMLPPKIFEYAATKTLMILYEGHYSGIIKPWKHYIPLKKDHSNMEEVVANIKSLNKLEEITQYAYNDLIISDKYSYKKLINIFDSAINDLDIIINLNNNSKVQLPTLKIKELNSGFKINKIIFLKKILSFFQKISWIKKFYHFTKAVNILFLQKKYCFYRLNNEIVGDILMMDHVIQYAEEIRKKTGIVYPNKKIWLNYNENDFVSRLLADPIFKKFKKNEYVSPKKNKQHFFVIKIFEKRINNLQ